MGANSANLLDFRRRKRYRIALAVSLVAVGGVIALQVLHSQEREPAWPFCRQIKSPDPAMIQLEFTSGPEPIIPKLQRLNGG